MWTKYTKKRTSHNTGASIISGVQDKKVQWPKYNFQDARNSCILVRAISNLHGEAHMLENTTEL